MEIIIKIDDDLYTRLFDNGVDNYDDAANMAKAIRKGKVLPKGHGDLIDRSNIYKAVYAEEDNLTGIGMTLEEMDEYNNGIDAMYALVRGAKPIIEAADKEYEAKVITRGNCMLCGKELTEGLFLCKECGDKANSRK